MKRKTNTLDAEYKRRGLMRPNQAQKLYGRHEDKGVPMTGDQIEHFFWRGTEVWGVKR